MLPGDQRFVMKIPIQVKRHSGLLPDQDFIVDAWFS
jgi:hypothetical protein